jgi:hypothetical protein
MVAMLGITKHVSICQILPRYMVADICHSLHTARDQYGSKAQFLLGHEGAISARVPFAVSRAKWMAFFVGMVTAPSW